ncbi:MAG TPA: hypothetical protein VFG20_22180 [Planctomycetaceae bacterium]|nr:hypothetical protein [Planctomycetaceae bacterium]
MTATIAKSLPSARAGVSHRAQRALLCAVVVASLPAVAFSQVGDGTPTPLSSSPAVSHFNLHLVVTEGWLNRFVARTDQTAGVIDDFILGAKVNGQQATTSQLQLDLRPHSEQIAATFCLQGQTGTSTQGVTEQATVFSRSQQSFQASKDCFFDGNVFSTRHAVISVRAKNQNVGAATRFDGTPLQPLVTPFVLKAAEQRRPQAEAVARDRVADRIYPEFDARIDRELASLNDRLETYVRQRLRQSNLLPDTQKCVSTDHEMHYAARLSAEGRDFEIVAPSRPLLQAENVRLFIHSSLLGSAAIRGGLAGLKTTDRQLDQMLRRIGLSSRSAGDTTGGIETQIEFDQQRPLTVLFEDDEMTVELLLKLRPAGQNLLPWLRIRIPFRLIEQDGERLLRPGQLQISSTEQGGIAPAVETLIKQTISGSLRDIPVPRTIGDASWYDGKPAPRVTTLRFHDGWLALGLD